MAEFLGTLALVLVGCGTAIMAGADIGLLGVALAFGLTVTFMAYAVGPCSGGHFNPAVSVGLAMAGKFSWGKVPMYWLAQLAGAFVAVLAIWLVQGGSPTGEMANFAANGFGDAFGGYSLLSAVIAEVVATFFFLTVIISTTKKDFPAGMGGLVVGLTLFVMIMFIGNVTNASLNPARSIMPALFAGGKFVEPIQLAVFILAPIAGAALAGVLMGCCDSCDSGSCDVKTIEA